MFGACLPSVGVMDMLRFHKFTAGKFWVDDYGSSDNEDEFKVSFRTASTYTLINWLYRFCSSTLPTTMSKKQRTHPQWSSQLIPTTASFQGTVSSLQLQFSTARYQKTSVNIEKTYICPISEERHLFTSGLRRNPDTEQALLPQRWLRKLRTNTPFYSISSRWKRVKFPGLTNRPHCCE